MKISLKTVELRDSLVHHGYSTKTLHGLKSPHNPKFDLVYDSESRMVLIGQDMIPLEFIRLMKRDDQVESREIKTIPATPKAINKKGQSK